MNNDTRAQDFYDAFAPKLIGDFLRGNQRAESAIMFACAELIQMQKQTILDLGFGLGWSSFEIAKALPKSKVTAIDLSPHLTELASHMFGKQPNVRYLCADLTESSWADDFSGSYDACIMLDVYEHVPKVNRGAFHEVLRRILTDDAVLILTCPTPLHQKFLREHDPKGLQPVDEDVTLKDLLALAADVGGTLSHLEHKSLWASNDYIHAAISKRIERQPVPRRVGHSLLPRSLRVERVRNATPVLGSATVRSLLSANPSKIRRAVKRLAGI